MTTANQALYKIAIAVAGISMAWAQGGAPPRGTPPGGTPPGDSTTSVTYYATYKLDGGIATQSNQTYTATAMPPLVLMVGVARSREPELVTHTPDVSAMSA